MKKQTGIWIDYKIANLIHLENGEVNKEDIISEIEDYRLKGGARSKTPYGPMDVTSESKLLARRKQQEKRYYKAISQKLSSSDELFIMGPAEAKVGLEKFLENISNFRPTILKVTSADSITENEKIALVKEFFRFDAAKT